MWLLTHTGELTHGKRFWLRPGTSHLLGRTRRDKSTFTFYIEDVKTISRKHLIIEVRDVAPGTAAQPEWRTEVALRDESKFGTMLDGESFNNSERVIGGRGDTKSVHEIRLGKWDVAWRLEWHPVVVTPSGLGKKKGDPVALLQKRLEPFDIKVVPQYVPGQTTHVVSVKRNTPRTLQALIEGRFMVSEAFLEALESKAKKLDAVVDAEGNEEVPRAPLEEDFDGNWPSEMEFVPPAGTEPVPRPPEMLAPNPGREAVFAGYTFVFSDSNQFDQLAPVVTQGNGKALLRELEAGSDNTEGFIRYVKNVAGENDMGEFEDGSEGKGVVVVRLTEPRGKKDEWWQRFYNTVDLGLGQRSINQNEFLDTIVTADASPLRQPLQEEEAISSNIPPPPPYTPVDPSQTSVMPSREEYTQVAESQMPPPSTAHEAPPSSEPPVPKTTRRGFRRALTASRFKGFDDFKPEELPKYIWDDDGEMQDTAVSQAEPTQASMAQSHLPAASQSQARVTRGTKRQQQAIEISDDEDNKLFPAASAMKRRKVEQQLQDPAMEDIAEVQDSPRKPKKTSLVLPSDVRKAKQEKDIDVLQVARERREKAEEERRLDEESLKEALEGMDLEEMKKLAKVEVMEIRPRSNVPDNAEGENGEEERWKPEWNGRKNFKKFRKRRPGEKDGESQAPLRGRKVIVTLQEVKHIDYNIDDEFFVDNERPFTEDSILDNWRKRDNARRAQRRAERKARDADSDLDDGSFRRTGRQMARNSLQQQRSNDIRGGPAKAIALHPEDDAEMQDFDPEEIAGQPRSEAIAAMTRETAAASSFRPGTASSTRSRASVSVAGGGTARGSRPSPAPSSQTLQGDGATQHQRPGSRASATSSTTATTTATRGKRGAMAPPPAEPPTKKKRKGKEAPPAKLGRGLGGDSGESGGSGDELKFRRRRR